MTRSRSNPDKLLFGILGSVPEASDVLASWNAYFRTHSIDASIDRYPCTEATIPERLSEMFHFDRRGYIVGLPLQKAIIRYLDRLDSSATEEGSVDTVLNDHGCLLGYFCNAHAAARRRIWLNAD
ncbi:hypothetical protein FJZ28_00265 [Candidatus Peregrinibacteria bacterium]|nr:hypothetical protein [Candidatus Peregrinibacteria bacterium]